MVLADILCSALRAITPLLQHEAELILGAKDQVISLQCELKFIQEFLRNSQGKRDRVKEVVNQIHDVALEIEDVLEEFAIGMAQCRRLNFLGKLWNLWGHTRMLRRVAVEIQRIKFQICEIYANTEKYGILLNEGEGSQEGVGASGEYSESISIERRRRHVEEEEVVSFDNHAATVIKMLDSGVAKRQVVSIVGMGGLGKTTLAKKIFNSDFATKNFNCRVWVDVSQDYDRKQLLWKLGKSVLNIEQEINKVTEEELSEKLKEGLATKSYLIVLDDIWDKYLWNDIKAAFPDNGKRSRILITSRSKQVASLTSHVSYFLPFLNEEDSWKLFIQKVSYGGQACPPKVEELVQRKILTKCRGLPLAIVVAAGILANKEKLMWSEEAKRLSWHLADISTECIDIISLSYHYLPPHLKQCFLYFGVFPEDTEIPVRQLIQLWVAEGFVDRGNRKNMDMDMEDIAEEYLSQLIDRSLIQVVSRRTDGGIKSCRIHDLLLDVCILEGRGEKFLELHTDTNTPLDVFIKPRRLSIHCRANGLRSDYLSMSNLSRVRSLLCVGSGNKHFKIRPPTGEDPFRRLSISCHVLRVLDLSSAYGYKFPPQVEKLVHLRYLRMNVVDLEPILPYISKILNLQTLHLTDLSKTSLCPNIWEMQQLRHMILSVKYPGGFVFPKDNGNTTLPNLRTLSGINIQNKDVKENLTAGKFPNLIKLKARCEDKDIEIFECLGKIQNLQRLSISGVFRFTDTGDLLSGLTKITLHRTSLDTSAFGKLGGIPNLQILKLLCDSLVGCKLDYHSSKGCFPRLQVLHMESLDVERWTMTGQGLPSLVHLPLLLAIC